MTVPLGEKGGGKGPCRRLEGRFSLDNGSDDIRFNRKGKSRSLDQIESHVSVGDRYMESKR